MLLLLIIGLVLLIGLIFGPQFWVRFVMRRHAGERADIPGTGAELAEHLLARAKIDDVVVEVTDQGDHYDPDGRCVRLLPQHFHGRSVTAVAIAAHEVSHAIQHARGEAAFEHRLQLVKNLIWVDRFAFGVLVVAPILFVFMHAPMLVVLQIGLSILFLAIRVLIHIVTLPVEFDASFSKALPILDAGGYLAGRDLPAARSVLRAAAMTYVAGALATLLNVARLLRVVRP
jgi:Zn-dependent membrane protease YugP